MNRLSLRTKALIIIMIITFIPFSLLGIVNYLEIRSDQINSDLEKTALRQENRANRIASWIDLRKSEVLNMSREALAPTDKDKIFYLRTEREIQVFQYDQLGYANLSGKAVMNDGTSFMINNETFYQRAMQGKIYVSDPYKPNYNMERFKPPHDLQKVGIISAPVYAAPNVMVGVLFATYSFPPKQFQDLLSLTEENTYLYNQEGLLLQKLAEKDIHALAFEGKSISEIVAQGTIENNYKKIVLSDRNFYVFINDIPNTNWYLVQLISERELVSTSFPVFWRIMFTIGTIMLVIWISIYLYFQRIISRLDSILKVTKSASAGSFSVEHLDASSGDEIGKLADSINMMTKRTQVMIERLNTVINQNENPVIVTDERYVMTYINKATEQLLGYRSEELIGYATPLVFMDFEEVKMQAEQFSKEIGKKVQPGVDLFIELRKIHQNYDYEMSFIHKYGTRIPVYIQSKALYNRNGKFDGIIAIVSDRSEQQKLVNVTNRLQDIVESAKDLIVSVDQSARIVYINQAGRTMLGIPEDESEQVEIFKYLPSSMYRLLLKGAIKARKIGFFETDARFLNRDHLYINVSVVIVAHRDSFTNEWIYSCISRDITEQIEVKNKLVRATKVAEEANQAKSNFLALMSHEIRTPLNGILGLSQLLQKTDMTALQRDYVHGMQRSSETLLHLVSDVLDFSKLEANKIETDLAPFQMDDMINHLAEQLNVMLGGKEHFEFIIELDSRIPQHVVGDSLRIEQVLLNLCVNAIKFTDDGFVKLSIEVADESENEVKVKFNVMDTGIGMNEKQLSKLFKPFTQADSSTTRKYGGTGLGLVISRDLVSLMGGVLKVSSEEGRGSHFSFQLTFQTLSPQKPIVELQSLDETDLNMVWVVEDHEEMSAHWISLLKKNQCTAICFSSWKVAYHRLLRVGEGAAPTFIMVDMEMSDMYGIDTWIEFHQEASLRQIPIITITTQFGREELLSLEPHQHPAAILIKPVTPNHFESVIHAPLNINVRKEIEPLDKLSDPKIDVQPLMEWSHLKILLVEDNKVNQLVAEEMIKLLGAKVYIANNGKEALDWLEQGETDVIVLMDIHMPVMDGLETTKNIKGNPNLRHVPVIALTANVLASDHDTYRKMGMDAILTKPLFIDQLKDVLSDYVQVNLQHEVAVTSDRVLQLGFEFTAFNIKEVIERLNGKTAILLHILKQFVKDYEGFVPKLQSILDRGDIIEAERLFHSLKGSASYLSAYRVYELAAEGERLSKNNNEKIYINEILLNLQFELQQLIDQILVFQHNHQQ